MIMSFIGCNLADASRPWHAVRMNLVLRIPDDIAARLSEPGADLEREALEALVLEKYRVGKVTTEELRRTLGFETRYELDGFLKAHGVFMDYTLADLERERRTLDALGL